MLKKKKADLENIGSQWKETPILPVVIGKVTKCKERQNKFRKRTTILPIFIKKIQERNLKERNIPFELENSRDIEDDESFVGKPVSKSNIRGTT